MTMITNSSSVPLRGAQMIVERIRPNVAIVTDVAHDTTTPLIDAKTVGGSFSIGKGPILTYAPAAHRKLLQLIVDTASEQGIPFQREAAPRLTGTDVDAFAYGAGGSSRVDLQACKLGTGRRFTTS
jgi:Cellulase M and related proteins